MWFATSSETQEVVGDSSRSVRKEVTQAAKHSHYLLLVGFISVSLTHFISSIFFFIMETVSIYCDDKIVFGAPNL